VKIPWSKPDISFDEQKILDEVIKSTWLSMGKRTREFEEKICNYIGCKYAVVVNNGTAALITAYLASGLKPGDYVITTTYTFIATIHTMLVLGLRPIVVDIEEQTLNIDINQIERAIKVFKDKVKAIVPVDVAGMPCNYDEIKKIADENSLILIEDAAEALGAEYKGRKIGNFEWVTIFSFHAAKQVATIEGGAVVTNDKEIAEKARLVRSHGEDPSRKYWHIIIGLNFRPTDLQSALGIVQLAKLDKYIENRNRIAKIYNTELYEFLEPQHVPSYVTKHPYMLYIAKLKDPYYKKRNKLLTYLNKKGIGYRLPWPPAHLQPSCQGKILYTERPSLAEKVFERIISLPIYNTMSEEEALYVVDEIRKFLKGAT